MTNETKQTVPLTLRLKREVIENISEQAEAVGLTPQMFIRILIAQAMGNTGQTSIRTVTAKPSK